MPRGSAYAFAKVNECPETVSAGGSDERVFMKRRKRGSFANQQEEQTFWRAYGMEILGPPLPTT